MDGNNEAGLNGAGLRIGILYDLDHRTSNEQLLNDVSGRLRALGVEQQNIEVQHVRRFYDLPFSAQQLIHSHKLHAIVILMGLWHEANIIPCLLSISLTQLCKDFSSIQIRNNIPIVYNMAYTGLRPLCEGMTVHTNKALDILADDLATRAVELASMTVSKETEFVKIP